MEPTKDRKNGKPERKDEHWEGDHDVLVIKERETSPK